MVTWGMTLTVMVIGGLIGFGLYLAMRSLWYLWGSNSLGLFNTSGPGEITVRQRVATLWHVAIVLVGLIAAYTGVAWAFVSVYR